MIQVFTPAEFILAYRKANEPVSEHIQELARQQLEVEK